ncbi:zinc ABC transporter substrate-binding protein [Marinobacter alexandrii]|jgi:zinc transport system substrate-binding protein|uniref:zinc ABC transporter substrate-binding protein n=1 Tax=Marinobacter alexandrii TaxID=2570351 RepID=UPI001FFE96CA|nr:zinc ABC transporter substrate-binding protein [Marinobacter alexandrii]MCK2148031.1 zinc ABC transporter substrate-binding protein [Marinobacter alexandrii]
MPPFKPARILAAALCVIAAPALAEIRVVTSLKPLTLLAQGIATTDTTITTLVPPGSSPHNYNMKPSQRRALDDADVIFWVGPDMETFLSRLLAGADFRQRTISLALDEPAMAESDHADEHDEYGHEDEDHHDEGHGHHDHGEGEDPHIWLDPALAEQMVEKMHKAMARQPDADTDALGRNLKQFKTRMAATEAEIRAKLEPARDISLFAYHDAFVRFAEHYGLKLEGVLTLNPELTPGARHIARIQDQLGQGHHPCLLTEPQFNPGIWEVITEDLDVTFSVWDPLGTDVEEGPEGYFEFQHSIADAVLNCLPEQAEH